MIHRLTPTVSVPSFARLITTLSSFGITTSPMTSTIMHSGPMMNHERYGRTYGIQ